MSSINYFTGYKYTKSIKIFVTIQYTRSQFQPPVSGPEYFMSDGSGEYIIDLTNFEVENVTATGATVSYNSTTHKATLTNPTTTNVTLTIDACGKPCIIYVGGHGGGETQSTWTGSYPSAGTIKYTNKYGIEQTVNVADLGCYVGWRQSSKFARIYDALIGSNVVCTNIGVTTKNGSGTTSGYYVGLRFEDVTGTVASYTVNSSSRVSYTFTNIAPDPSKYDADVRIISTR